MTDYGKKTSQDQTPQSSSSTPVQSGAPAVNLNRSSDMKVGGLTPAQYEQDVNNPPVQNIGASGDLNATQTALGILLIEQGYLFSTDVAGQQMWRFASKAGMIPGIQPIDHSKNYTLSEACQAFIQAAANVEPTRLKRAA